MAIKFSCPMCGTSLIAPDDAVGRDIRCSSCRAVFPVPEPREAPPAEPRRGEPRPDDDRPLFEQGSPYSDDALPMASDYDDESPRPPSDSRATPVRHRRRRRPPPPPPGRGVLFWLLLIFGALAVLTVGCCGGVYLLIPNERWQTHHSVEGGFKVDLPARQQKNLPVPGAKDDPNLKVEGAIFWKRGEFYAVMYTPVPPPGSRGETDERVLDESVRAMETDHEVRRVVRKERITVSGFPGREVEFVGTDGGTYLARVVIADRLLYVAIAGGRFVGPGNANIRRFLDSFQLTEPKQARGW